MFSGLPLESPRWIELKTGGTAPARVTELLQQIISSRAFGRPWQALIGGPILDQGTPYASACAVLPHAVVLAEQLPAEQLVDFWIDVGFLVSSLERAPHIVPADLAADCYSA